MKFVQILVVMLVFCGVIYAEGEFRKRDEVNAQKTTNKNVNANYQKRQESTKRKTIKTQSNNASKATQKTTNKNANTPKTTQKDTQDSKDLQESKPLPVSKDSKDFGDIKSQKTTTKAKTTIIKKITEKKKPLGYRNITIQNIKKQKSVGIDFFVGLQLGIDVVSMQDITQIDRDTNTKKSTSASGSFGAKGGIISEDEWVGGRFYAELSYLKIPKFDVLNVGVDLDLLIKYYETSSWKIGGFIGAGGGMNMAFIADKSLDNAGKKSLISVGWVNVGLTRFIYYHSTGIHGAELNIKIVYVTPTIYSLKDKNTGVTTSYKASSSTIMFSYTYQF